MEKSGNNHAFIYGTTGIGDVVLFGRGNDFFAAISSRCDLAEVDGAFIAAGI